VVSQFFYKGMRFISHFTPAGSPIVLIPLLKVIEIISIRIRPITLGVRLAVNLITGHLMLRMFSSSSSNRLVKFSFIFIIMFFFGILVFFYERCVCLVQGLVYFLMLTQYLDEHP